MTPDMSLNGDLSASATLSSGEAVSLRPLRPDDAPLFGRYLIGLSEDTRSRWGPHAFDQATADSICASLQGSEILRLIATVSHGGREEIVSYMLLYLGARESDSKRYAERGTVLDPATDAAVAPSVADAYQNRGVGGVMMRYVLSVAAKLGRKRVVLWDGVQERNERAVRFYARCGFVKVGEFLTDLNNHDMILHLPRSTNSET